MMKCCLAENITHTLKITLAGKNVVVLNDKLLLKTLVSHNALYSVLDN